MIQRRATAVMWGTGSLRYACGQYEKKGRILLKNFRDHLLGLNLIEVLIDANWG